MLDGGSPAPAPAQASCPCDWISITLSGSQLPDELAKVVTLPPRLMDVKVLPEEMHGNTAGYGLTFL